MSAPVDTHTHHTIGGRLRAALHRFWAAALVVVLAVAGVVTFTNVANALGPGIGFGDWSAGEDWHGSSNDDTR